MSENGVSYANHEPPVVMQIPMPADLFEKLGEYAPIQTHGDINALVVRCVREKLDPLNPANATFGPT